MRFLPALVAVVAMAGCFGGPGGVPEGSLDDEEPGSAEHEVEWIHYEETFTLRMDYAVPVAGASGAGTLLVYEENRTVVNATVVFRWTPESPLSERLRVSVREPEMEEEGPSPLTLIVDAPTEATRFDVFPSTQPVGLANDLTVQVTAEIAYVAEGADSAGQG